MCKCCISLATFIELVESTIRTDGSCVMITYNFGWRWGFFLFLFLWTHGDPKKLLSKQLSCNSSVKWTIYSIVAYCRGSCFSCRLRWSIERKCPETLTSSKTWELLLISWFNYTRTPSSSRTWLWLRCVKADNSCDHWFIKLRSKRFTLLNNTLLQLKANLMFTIRIAGFSFKFNVHSWQEVNLPNQP